MIYRVMQELVNNSIKHSNAKNITVQIISNKNELILSVEDDGIGIDQEKLNSSKGNHQYTNQIHPSHHQHNVNQHDVLHWI